MAGGMRPSIVKLSLAAMIMGLLIPTSAAVAAIPSLPPEAHYVALGDSYSSGEGLANQASDYIGESAGDSCHRAVDAYPELVASNLEFSEFKFVACSGATSGSSYDWVPNFSDGKGSLLRGRNDEPSQISASTLNSSTTEISLTIGGNDVGFANLAQACISMMTKAGPVQSVVPLPFSGCKKLIGLAEQVIGDGTVNSQLGQALVDTYEQILNQAPNARMVVLTYPQLLTPNDIAENAFCPLTVGFPGAYIGTTSYLGFTSNVQAKFNQLETLLNADIRSAVAKVAGSWQFQDQIKLTDDDINAMSSSKAQPCNTKTMSASQINGIRFAGGAGATALMNCIWKRDKKRPCNQFISTETLHPTREGHAAMAAAVIKTFGRDWSSWQCHSPSYSAADKTTTVGLGGVRARYDTDQPDTWFDPGVPGTLHVMTATQSWSLDVPVAPTASFDPGYNPTFGMSRLCLLGLKDQASPVVMVDRFWGGAHCCYFPAFYSMKNGQYSLALNVGETETFRTLRWNANQGFYPVAHRGQVYLRTSDGSFDYVFDSYAASANPLAIYRFDGSSLVDVTSQFRGAIRKEAAFMDPTNSRSGSWGRGIVSAWVADKCALGEGADAWSTVLTGDAQGRFLTSSDSYPGFPNVGDYPRALSSFLKNHGYCSGQIS